MCHDASGERGARYAADVVSLHRNLSFSALLSQVDPRHLIHVAERGDGLLTVALQTQHLPHRYLVGLQGFRLAQYLQLGWICEDVMYSSAIFCEPVDAVHPQDVHVMTMSGSGAILGYLALAGPAEGDPADLLDPDRGRFPVEQAHNINLFDHVAGQPGVRTDQVRELKRFVHARTVSDRTQRLRITLELLFGMGQVLARITPAVRTLVGDVEENVALRHLLLAGLDVKLIEGTTPRLTEQDLLRHAYVQRSSVKPFVAHLPSEEEVQQRISMLESTLDSPDLFDATGRMSRSQRGILTRVSG
ncbi:hypothetical protein BA895_04710 [Humibacillus sp. DSM 29435]|uniref:hypothetical protein n=1 Tax=Humibacillus sp. DSM 29435 TaxID=1869167 RepID=UPI000872678C|nr:hypothetical protein [Humibacillus sp. DSM 29435]OFE15823.1 hypothetical protein BA895_04710 [Humibacillus sp. DSM 29435]